MKHLKKLKLSLILFFISFNVYANAFDKVNFELLDNRIFVDVFLNGKGPFKFIFDTGGSNSMTFELAKKLNLKVKDSGMATGAGNNSQKMGSAITENFKIGKINLTNQKFLVMDYSKIQNAFKLKALDGIFGYEVLALYLTSINYEKKEIEFFSKIADFNSSNYVKIPFKILFDKPFIKTHINGLKANTLLDTGDRSALTVTKKFLKNKKISPYFNKKTEVISGYGIGGPIPAIVSVLDSLEIMNDSPLTKVATRTPTTVAGLNAVDDLDASIGNEVLKQFNIALDYQTKTLYIQKNKNFGQKTIFKPVDKTF